MPLKQPSAIPAGRNAFGGAVDVYLNMVALYVLVLVWKNKTICQGIIKDQIWNFNKTRLTKWLQSFFHFVKGERV